MYADGNARGGVLEPEGIVEIKFRAADLVALMHRLDPIILELKAGSQPGTETAVKKREAELMPIYRQVSPHTQLISMSHVHLEYIQEGNVASLAAEHRYSQGSQVMQTERTCSIY